VVAYKQDDNGQQTAINEVGYYSIGDFKFNLAFDTTSYREGNPFYAFYNSKLYYGEFNLTTASDVRAALTEITTYSGVSAQTIVKP
jgi:hypothetical protein